MGISTSVMEITIRDLLADFNPDNLSLPEISGELIKEISMDPNIPYIMHISKTRESLKDILEKLLIIRASPVSSKLINTEIFSLIKATTTSYISRPEKLDLSLRNLWVNKFGWSIPSNSAVRYLVNLIGSRSVLEVGAGRGLWSCLLRNDGVNIICTSLHQKDDEDVDTWTEVELISAHQAVKKYPTEVLFVCWGAGALADAINDFQGDSIIVIGEDYGGCTEDIPNDDHNFVLYGGCTIPRWYTSDDKIKYYRRRS